MSQRRTVRLFKTWVRGGNAAPGIVETEQTSRGPEVSTSCTPALSPRLQILQLRRSEETPGRQGRALFRRESRGPRLLRPRVWTVYAASKAVGSAGRRAVDEQGSLL